MTGKRLACLGVSGVACDRPGDGGSGRRRREKSVALRQVGLRTGRPADGMGCPVVGRLRRSARWRRILR